MTVLLVVEAMDDAKRMTHAQGIRAGARVQARQRVGVSRHRV